MSMRHNNFAVKTDPFHEISAWYKCLVKQHQIHVVIMSPSYSIVFWFQSTFLSALISVDICNFLLCVFIGNYNYYFI